MSEHHLTGIHKAHLFKPHFGDWSLDGDTGVIFLKELTPFLTKDRLKRIKIDEIGWKGKHWTNEESINCRCCNGERYEKCDIDFAGIVAIDTPNPYSKKYRMIDGKHRIRKMQNNGITHGSFYVFTYKEIKKFVKLDVVDNQN